MMSTETINKKLFMVDEFNRMADAGILPEDGRFKLIRGEIVEMRVPGSPHGGRVKRPNHLFSSRLGGVVIVGVQDPLRRNLYSQPLPDSVLLRPRAAFYTESHPAPGDALLVVEVVDNDILGPQTAS